MPFTAEEAAEQSAILADLRALGYDFSSLSAFAQSGVRYEDAVPTLLEWLRKARTPMMQRAVARTLTNPSAKGAAMPALVDAFRNFTDEAGTRWAVGNSIETAYGTRTSTTWQRSRSILGTDVHGRWWPSHWGSRSGLKRSTSSCS